MAAMATKAAQTKTNMKTSPKAIVIAFIWIGSRSKLTDRLKQYTHVKNINSAEILMKTSLDVLSELICFYCF